MKAELAREIDRLIEAEDDGALKSLFIDHFSEFDPDEQEEIFVSFFMTAVEEQAADVALRPMQQEALEIATKLKALRDVLLLDQKKGSAGGKKTPQ